MYHLLNSGATDSGMVLRIRENKRLLCDHDDIDNNALQIVIKEQPHFKKTIACILEMRPGLVRHRNEFGKNALYMAVQHDCSCFIIKRLIQIDPDTMYDVTLQPYYQTPFQLAINIGELVLVQCMITADPNVVHQITSDDAVDVDEHSTLQCHPLTKTSISLTYEHAIQRLLHAKPSLFSSLSLQRYVATAEEHKCGHVIEAFFRLDPRLQYDDFLHNTALHIIKLGYTRDSCAPTRTTCAKRSQQNTVGRCTSL